MAWYLIKYRDVLNLQFMHGFSKTDQCGLKLPGRERVIVEFLLPTLYTLGNCACAFLERRELVIFVRRV
jgi:hypothetical protein